MDGFTVAQQQVISADDGRMAVVAGPGTGKTTTLAGRITHLVQQRGADPASILALSFTTEAARRLRREVARQLGDRAQDVAILTLHALGRKVIDTWAGQLGYDDRPAVVHQVEARALLASAATSLGWDPATIPLEELATAVDRCRLLAEDERTEAEFVAQQIGALLDRGLLPHPGEAAVLFRTRAQADVVASALRAAGVPYALHGHAELFSARVVRDSMAYLRLAVNPADRAALARIVNVPPRGLGRLAATLPEEPATTAELPGRAADFGTTAVAAAAALMATIYELHAEAQRGTSAVALLDRALDRSGYRAWLERHPEGTSRLRTFARLRVLAQRADLSLSEWLDALALGDEPPPPEDEVVYLSSVHQAKGKEFRVTFTLGLEEGLLPHYRAIRGTEAGEAALEEELKVLYVALTRARERLFLSACRERTRGSQTERRQPSRWLSALPPELLAPAA